MTNEVSADISIESRARGSTRVSFSLSSWFNRADRPNFSTRLTADLPHNRLALNYREEERYRQVIASEKKGVIDMYYII